MPTLRYIMLDVLKPHSPGVLDFARAIAEAGRGWEVQVSVSAVDAKTETVLVEVQGEAVDYPRLEAAIAALGGSVHSVDRVRVEHHD